MKMSYSVVVAPLNAVKGFSSFSYHKSNELFVFRWRKGNSKENPVELFYQ